MAMQIFLPLESSIIYCCDEIIYLSSLFTSLEIKTQFDLNVVNLCL